MEDVKLASSGTPSTGRKEKPVVVRVKRKASQASLDAFWLEINERPLKRPLLDFEKLSISDHESKVSEALMRKRLLVQHVETVSPSEAIEDVLQSLLPNSCGSKDFTRKMEVRKGYFKQDKKHDQLRSAARQEREELVRNARFEQIWKSRRGDIDSLRQLCHLYDVVRVDAEDEKLMKKEVERVSVEDNAILCNYLPLLREHIPSAAEEIESEIKAYLSGEGSGSDSIADLPTEDGYVYDLYTVEDDFTGNDEDMSNDFPLVQVNNENDFDDMPDSDNDSEDSNAEDHPNNDYPDEESSNKEDEEVDPFGDFECPNSDCEDEEMLSKKEEEEESSEGGKYVHIFSDSDCSD
ncbi:RNA-directed DNA methylation 4 isoform X2 [Phalaenopsis equestris]|uniref:RNA-directed DNA methylation 4 isoform X2 n=1 Tax=Phalaenopsis equestris TaxID=78828 RepID=UPI0009E4482B|nr:RNA-directed DNA methylation 4 isoform X2 [Phalaenopsis equestris]